MKSSVHKQLLGKSGENLAVSYLQKNGFSIVQRNFKARYGEIDIVCLKKGVLVFVEVKTRIGHDFGYPEESVTPKKLREVIKTAEYYKLLHPELPEAIRIDVVAIELNDRQEVLRFNHIQSVT